MKYRCWRLFLWCMGCCLVPSALAQTVSRGAYLQNATDSAITIKWLSDSVTNSRVWYGNDPLQLLQVVDSGARGHSHTVRISGLQPATQYYYAVGSTAGMMEGADEGHRFRTNPVPGAEVPIKIWVIGDFGRNNDEERWVRDAYADYVTAHRTADVWLWMGDNAYDSGTENQYQTNVFDIYDSIFAFQPFWPTPGNHDYLSVNQAGQPPFHTGPYYNIVEVPWKGEAGGLPSGGEMFYSYDYGNVHFVSLNSELSTWVTAPNSPMAVWLEEDLMTTSQPWKVVYFHQPPHSRGSHNSDNFFETYMISMRNNFMPLLERNGVDLVLCGHSHVYERSRLMYGFYDWSFMYNLSYELDHGSGSLAAGSPYRKSLSDSTQNHGTVYATVGNSGSTTYSPALNHPLMYYGWGCDTCVGSLIIDVHKDTLQARYYASTGQILDEFAILKDLRVSTNPPVVSEMAFKVWPNPFSKELNLQFDLSSPARVVVQLVDMQGRQHFLRRYGRVAAGLHEVNLSDAADDLPAGIYVLRVMADDKVVHEKVIKYKL